VPTVTIQTLTNIDDIRGSSFSIPRAWAQFLPAAVDLHVTSLKPGHTRGNHYHKTRKEVIIVVHADGWALSWDNGRTSRVQHRDFVGRGAVMLTVEPGAAHAVVNSGRMDLYTIGLTDGLHDPEDTVRVEITAGDQGSKIKNQEK